MKKTINFGFTLFLFTISVHAQTDDLLSQLGEEKTTEHITNAFKSSRVINTHSMEMLAPGTMDFRILHRFGDVSKGGYELFGLDQASMRLGFDFGITPNFMLGVGRSTNKKEVDGFLKYRLLWQSRGQQNIPLSLIAVTGMTINGLKNPLGVDGVSIKNSQRLAYYNELIVGRKFSQQFSLQITPTYIHNNIVATRLTPNDLFAVGLGGRWKFNKRMALVWDYTYLLNRFPANVNYNPFSLGIDIETGGHVFQLHFSNAAGMNEHAFITDENGDWLKGQIRFGFNLSRVFQIAKRQI